MIHGRTYLSRPSDTHGGEVELREYVAILQRRKWIIAYTTAITVLLVTLATLLTTPQYQASTVIQVMTPLSGGAGNLQYDTNYADRFMNTYATMATNRAMTALLAERLGVSEAPHVTAEVLPNTELMQLTIQASQPTLAARGADTLARLLIARMVQEAESDAATGLHSNTISVVQPATVPQNAVIPNKKLNVALGLVLGLAGGIGLAFLFENLALSAARRELSPVQQAHRTSQPPIG